MAEPDAPQGPPALHPALAGLGFLLGTWRGVGVGGYPTIEGFRYEEELVVTHDGRPFLEHRSRSWIVSETGERIRPSHREAGWWRPGALPGEVELVLAEPTGLVTVYLGRLSGHSVELASDVVARTGTAKEVSAVRRLYGQVEDDLAYAMDLAAVGQPLQPHLSARLVADPPGCDTS